MNTIIINNDIADDFIQNEIMRRRTMLGITARRIGRPPKFLLPDPIERDYRQRLLEIVRFFFHFSRALSKIGTRPSAGSTIQGQMVGLTMPSALLIVYGSTSKGLNRLLVRQWRRTSAKRQAHGMIRNGGGLCAQFWALI